MDARFQQVWSAVKARESRGEGLPTILRSLSIRDLIALLAAVPREMGVMANVVATELLNRIDRLRSIGSLLIGLTGGVVLYVTDGIYSGTWLDLQGGFLAYAIAIASLSIILVSLMAIGKRWRENMRGRRGESSF